MDYKYIVATLCQTYNQSLFIEDSLKGFAMQETTFPVVYIIIDDASTDGEPDVLRCWAKNNLDFSNEELLWIEKPYGELAYSSLRSNPKLSFAILLLSENHFGKKSKSPYIAEWFENARYVALCEGDDYWTDYTKLQRQVTFLDSNPDYVACAENATCLFPKSGMKRLFSLKPERDVTVKELMQNRCFPTASVLYRSHYRNEFNQNFTSKFDTMLWCFLASKGKFRYIDVDSSVYRRGVGITATTDRFEWMEQSECRYGEIRSKFCQYISKRDVDYIIARVYLSGIKYYGLRFNIRKLWISFIRFLMVSLGLRNY